MNSTLDTRARRSIWLLEARKHHPQVTPAVINLGMLIALKYVNSGTGLAWPSQERLADDLQTTVRSIRRDMKVLVDIGFLSVTVGNGKTSNRYRLCEPEARTKPAESPGRQRPPAPRTVASPEPRGKNYNQEGLEPSSEPETTLNSNSDGQKPRDRRKSALAEPMRADWKPNEVELAVAKSAGLSTEETESEARKFRTYFVAAQIKRPGWTKSWRVWVSKFAQRKRGNRALRPSSGMGGFFPT